MHYRASLDTVRPSWFLLGIFLGDALFVSLEKWCLGQDIRRWLIHVPTENDKILYQNELKSIEFQITFLLICSFIALPSVQFLPDPTDGFKWKHMALSLINWFLSGSGRVVNFPPRTAQVVRRGAWDSPPRKWCDGGLGIAL